MNIDTIDETAANESSTSVCDINISSTNHDNHDLTNENQSDPNTNSNSKASVTVSRKARTQSVKTTNQVPVKPMISVENDATKIVTCNSYDKPNDDINKIDICGFDFDENDNRSAVQKQIKEGNVDSIGSDPMRSQTTNSNGNTNTISSVNITDENARPTQEVLAVTPQKLKRNRKSVDVCKNNNSSTKQLTRGSASKRSFSALNDDLLLFDNVSSNDNTNDNSLNLTNFDHNSNTTNSICHDDKNKTNVVQSLIPPLKRRKLSNMTVNIINPVEFVRIVCVLDNDNYSCNNIKLSNY